MPLHLHLIAPRARVGLLASTLFMVTLLAIPLLAPGPLPGGEARGLLLLTGLGGTALGCALRWTLRLKRENARLRAQVQGAFEMVGVAAHDLGNPLLALQLRLYRLRGHLPADSRAQEGLAIAERETRRMGLLVHDLLDLSRLSVGPLALEREELDLTALAREVAERFADQAAAAGSLVRLHAQGPVRGQWDRERLDRVATNLLSNALKFGQGHPIEVEVLADGPHARLAVRDHGVGIPHEAQERLFGRFERLGDTGQPGAGLGLYIVRQLVEAHGGTIHVSSRPGQGSTFTVELPQALA
ncbi:sensor histidine kinase [Archangium lipolyticum]|uniref:sensor histidine kinase n=1 Tax=Archangium lipolyticum TaxID=2970465 RepID=UPI002149CA76|nr:HAMP domain-containing sensor histidine kinase [Archangium lipolyticum]